MIEFRLWYSIERQPALYISPKWNPTDRRKSYGSSVLQPKTKKQKTNLVRKNIDFNSDPSISTKVKGVDLLLTMAIPWNLGLPQRYLWYC